MPLLLISTASGSLAILIAFRLFRDLRKAKIHSAQMAEIASFIAVGVQTYLSRQLSVPSKPKHPTLVKAKTPQVKGSRSR